MSAQQIQLSMKELREIEMEIQRMKTELKKLVEKEKKLKSYINQYVHDNELPGLKYQDFTVLAVEKKTRQRKTKVERNQELEDILSQHGIRDTQEVLNEITEALKGKEEIKLAVKIKKQK